MNALQDCFLGFSIVWLFSLKNIEKLFFEKKNVYKIYPFSNFQKPVGM